MANQIYRLYHAMKTLIADINVHIPQKNQGLQNYFSRKDSIRMEKVSSFLDRRCPSRSLLSADEIVAIFSLIAANESFVNVIHAMKRISEENMGSCFDEQFFHAVENTSRDLMTLGLHKEAGDLIKIGEISANMCNNTEWANHFKEIIDIGLASRIRDYPFLPQRGW
jgi:hypothetical protein